MRKFRYGQRVKKKILCDFRGLICGTYATALTPIGYVIEDIRNPTKLEFLAEDRLEPWIEKEEESAE